MRGGGAADVPNAGLDGGCSHAPALCTTGMQNAGARPRRAAEPGVLHAGQRYARRTNAARHRHLRCDRVRPLGGLGRACRADAARLRARGAGGRRPGGDRPAGPGVRRGARAAAGAARRPDPRRRRRRRPLVLRCRAASRDDGDHTGPRRLGDRAGPRGDRARPAAAGHLPRDAAAERRARRDADPASPREPRARRPPPQPRLVRRLRPGRAPGRRLARRARCGGDGPPDQAAPPPGGRRAGRGT